VFLTDEDLHRLTGFVRPSAQARWLRDHGYRYSVNGLGKISVAVAEVNRHQVGGKAPRQEPDFDALREHVTRAS
jgi:hypothetical protein